MMSLTFGLFTQVSGLGPLGPLVLFLMENLVSKQCKPLSYASLFGICSGSAVFAYDPFMHFPLRMANGEIRLKIINALFSV